MVLTKAELESLTTDPELYKLVSKGKVSMVKVRKVLTTEKNAVIILKFEQCDFNIE